MITITLIITMITVLEKKLFAKFFQVFEEKMVAHKAALKTKIMTKN